MTTDESMFATYEWFEHNSGWAPPDVDTIAEWLADDFCRAPDDCVVVHNGWCEHGLASWWLILEVENARKRERGDHSSSDGEMPIGG